MMTIRSKKILIIVLLVAIVGMTFGFAVFSNTLTIYSSASVWPNESAFRIQLSGSSTDSTVTEIIPYSSTGATGSMALIENGVKITNLSAAFTEPGQEIEYVGYAHNLGEYVAYLKQINFNLIDGESIKKKCVAGDDTTQSLVDVACNAITLKLKTNIPKYGSAYGNFDDSANLSSLNDINSLEYAVGTFYISYAEDGARADGEFSVYFGDIELVFSSSNN